MVYKHVKEGTGWSPGWEGGFPEEMMTGRCEGYVGEVWVGRKITPGKRGR